MPTFPRPKPDTPASLQGFTIGAQVSDDGTNVTVALFVSVAVVGAGGQVHQVSDELGQYLSAGQVTAFTNAATALYAQAKVDLLS